ncbi:MAG: hypothetical protein QXE12_03795 [Conexivisphaerales archaeon]
MNSNTIVDDKSEAINEISTQYGKKGFSLRIGSRVEMIYRLFRTLSKLTDRVSVMITDNGVFSRVMDAQHIMMIEFRFEKNVFESFSVIQPPVNITFDLDSLLTILSRGVKSARRVELISEDIGRSKLLVMFDGNSKAEYTMDCELFTGSYPELPKIEFQASLRIPSRLLKDVLEDMKVVSEDITIIAENECFYFSAKNDSNGVVCKLEHNSPQVYNMQINGKVFSRFYSTYIMDFIDLWKPNIIDVDLGDRSPVRITEVFNSGSYDLGYVSFYLAPLSPDDS